MTKSDTDSHNSISISLFIAFAMGLFALSFCTLPNFIMFGAFSGFDAPTLPALIKFNLPHAIVTLDDDIMITMRSGYMIHATGLPQYNLTDIAQPSTSYLAPYLFYVLDLFIPRAQSPFLYVLLILSAAIASLLLIYKSARIKANAIFLIVAFLLTTTFIHQAFLGWDHFLQGVFVCAALSLLAPRSMATSVFAALINVGAVAARPDTLLISCAILAVFYIQNRAQPRHIFSYAITYCSGLAFVFGYNVLNFGHLFATPVRLKALASTDLSLQFNYILKNLLFHYTAGQIWIGLFLLIILNPRRYLDASMSILLFASCATALIANINGDVFFGYRMMWTPALMLAYIVVEKSDQPILPWMRGFMGGAGTHATHRTSPLLLLVASLVMVFVARAMIEKNIRSAISTDYQDSIMARQFAMASWVNTNLSPENGAIGVFFGGTGYHLPTFEIADLLGKADEMIATSPPKWGAPGHNKWNFDLSIARWNPQALFVEANVDPTQPDVMFAAQDAKDTRADGSYAYELFLNETVRERYQFCYLFSPDIRTRSPALFLRQDVAERLKATRPDRLDCVTIAALN